MPVLAQEPFQVLLEEVVTYTVRSLAVTVPLF